ncbi:MAG: glycosyltransferase [Pseudomonadota bacterium]
MGTDTATPDAAVIIPHYNDVTRLRRCLKSLMENDRTGVEILVVDNGSTQSLEEVKVAFPEIRFLTETEKGAAAARNLGVRESTAPLLFFIDADCVAAPDWLTKARDVAPLADLIGGRVDVFDETPKPRSGAEAFETVFAFHNKNYVEKKAFSVTANLLTTRATFEAVGDFINGVSEDSEWCQRAVGKGYSIRYADTLVVSHPTRSDWSALKRKWYRMTAESFSNERQNGTSVFRWGLKALSMPLSAIVHMPKVLTNSRLNGLGERGRAAATLFRLRLQRMIWMLRQTLGLSI